MSTPATPPLISQLWRGLTRLGGMRLIEMVLGVVVASLLARTLGLERLGVYTVVMASLSLAAVPTQFGMPTVVMREVARAEANQDWAKLKGVVVLGYLVIAVFGVLIVSLFFVAQAILPSGTLTYAAELSAAWPLLFIISFTSMGNSVLCGLRKTATGYAPESVVRPALYVALLLGFENASAASLDVVSALQLQVVAASAGLVLSVALVGAFVPRQVWSHRMDISERTAWTASAIRHGLSQGLRVLQPETLILLLAALSTTETIGLFRVAQRGASLMAFITSTITVLVAPYIARLYAQDDQVRLQKLLTRCAQSMTGVSIAMVFAAILGGKLLLTLLFGVEYLPAYNALIVLTVGQLAIAFFGPAMTFLLMTGHDVMPMKGLFFGTLVCLAATALLLPVMPVLAPAWGQVAGSFALVGLLGVYIRRHVGLRPTAVGW